MRKLIVLALTLLLAGCAAQTVREKRYHDQFVALDGAILQLNRALPIMPGNTRVFIQHGRVLQEGGANQFATQCNFEVRNLSDRVQTIKPGNFLINRVQQVDETVSMLQPVRVASLGGMFSSGGSSYFEGYHFWLTSPTQPQVMRMTCLGAFASPGQVERPTLQEIRRTLGQVAEIRDIPKQH